MATPRRIEIYDTTLRDGTQGEGFSLSLQDKLMITIRLDEMGVDYIEGGFPLSNPKDEAFFRDVREIKFKHARIAAFGMTRRRGVRAEDDPGMQAMLAANTPAVTLVGKTSEHQVKAVLAVTLEENLQMIADSIRLMKQAGRQVLYDAEHFFDAYRANSDYALRTLAIAQEAGASVLVLCDTNGGSMPEQIAEAVAAARQHTGVDDRRPHPQRCRRRHRQRLGRRQRRRRSRPKARSTASASDAATWTSSLLIANLQLKYHMDCLQPGTLARLTETSRYVYETANLNLVSGQPYVGTSAFAHKGGMHVHAVQKDVSTYEHVKPELVGNNRKILISELSGQSNIAAKAGRKFAIEDDKITLRKVLQRVQDLENQGFQFEAAEASFELLLRKEIGRYKQFFQLDHYRIVVLKTDHNTPIAEATVKLQVNGQTEHRVAEGDGPVNALDGALRKALASHYPAITGVHLVDYKVRVINSRDETAASVRVIIESRRDRGDGTKEVFGTIGVSENVIDASWQALVDAYEYHLIQVEEAKEAGEKAKVGA